MTFRQFVVCCVLGPVCVLFQVTLFCMLPMFAAMGWLVGDDDPVSTSWQIVTEPPRMMFLSAYRGLGR